MKEMFIHWVLYAFDFWGFVGNLFNFTLTGKPGMLRLEVFRVDVGWRVAVKEFTLLRIR